MLAKIKNLVGSVAGKAKPVAGVVGSRAVAAVKGPKIHGILHAGLTVSDFERSVAWYHEMFGFYLVSEDTLTGEAADKLEALYGHTGLSIRMGFMRAPDGSVLELFQFEPADEPQPMQWNRVGYTHIALSVTNVPAMMEKLKAKGVKFITGTQFVGGAHWAFFRDPDGNLLELIDLHANRVPLKYLGGIVGRINKNSKYAGYYR